jgi:DNA repair protein RecO (recombination protein O)
MSSEKADAIVIRSVDFSESSLIVTLFTREFGKIGAMAKGAKRLKSPFEPSLDLLALCRIVFLHKTSDALDLLTEAKLQRRFRLPGRNLLNLYSGYYVAELLGELTDENDPSPELFNLADDTLAALSAGESPARYVTRFELGLLRILGHIPSLDLCAECGQKPSTTARIAFGQIDGGVLCDKCRLGKKHVIMVSPGVLKTMSQLAFTNANAWQRMDIAPGVLGELRAVMNNHMMNLLGRKPRMYEYLGVLGKG